MAYSADGKLLASASGLVIAPGKLVTSCQVLARARAVKLRSGREILGARLEFPDTERDLCQFDVPNLATPVLAQESARTLRPGQRVYVIGFSIGDEASIVEGLVSAVRDSGTQQERIQTSVPAMRGLLGAGVFDQEGRLVGVVTSSPKEAAATAFAVPADWLAQLPARGQAALAARAKSAGAGTVPGLPAAGTTWIYAFLDRIYSPRQTEIRTQVLRVNGSLIEESVTVGAPPVQEVRRTVDTRDSRFLENPVGASASLMEWSPYLLGFGDGKLPTDLPQASGYPAGGGLPGWNQRVRVLNWESVTVPAGTYRALRVQIDGQRVSQPFARVAMRFRLNVWYAPEVKRYVRLEHQQWLVRDQPFGHDVVELLSYKAP